MESILISIKKLLGLSDDYEFFDMDIIMFINTAISTLRQLGVGPMEGFSIEDASTTWDELVQGRMDLNDVRTYIYLRVRLLFDPPQNSFLVNAITDQLAELTWRLNVQVESPCTEVGDAVVR